MLNVGNIGTKSLATGSVRRRRRRHAVKCVLLASILLTLIESVTAVEYIDRECALKRQVSDASSSYSCTVCLAHEFE